MKNLKQQEKQQKMMLKSFMTQKIYIFSWHFFLLVFCRREYKKKTSQLLKPAEIFLAM
jgi:hypothetical protein